MVRKFLQEESESEQKKKRGKWENFFKEPKGIIVGGILAIVSVAILYSLRSEETKVEVAQGISPEQVETSLKENVKPLLEGQRSIAQKLVQTDENLKRLVEEIKVLVQTIKEENNKNVKQEKKEEKVPQTVWEAGNLEISRNATFNINLIGHKSNVSFVTTVEGKTEVETPDEFLSGKEKKVKKKTNEPLVYIPAGSVVQGRLMTGFVAPSEGLFPPVLIVLEKSIWTPNWWYIPLEGCVIVTKAQYNISMGKAVVGGRDAILSCVLPDGKVVQKTVNVAIGESYSVKGKAFTEIGLTGKEVWLTARDLAQIALLTSGEGVANAFQQASVEQSLTPQGNVLTVIKNRALYSVLGGVRESLNRFNQFWLKKYDKKVPAIEVEPKRIFVLFVTGVNLGVKENEL